MADLSPALKSLRAVTKNLVNVMPDVAQEIVEVPITGKIISIEVKEGAKVSEGDVLCVLESMKMENPILAPVSGTIASVGIAVDQVVKPGDTVATIEY